MSDLDIIKLTDEVEHYPALLAWLQYLHVSGTSPDMAYPARWLDEHPCAAGADASDLFDRYIERGETGAAAYLARKNPQLAADKVPRRKSQLAQQLADAFLTSRDISVLIKEANPNVGTGYAERLNAIEDDQVLVNFRPGLALDKVQNITEALQEEIAHERDRVIRKARSLLESAVSNPDLETAVRRIEEIIGVPEGLASAAHLLGVAERAAAGMMSQDDIRRLYTMSADNVRLVRSWSEVRAIVGNVSGPSALAERLDQEVFTRALRLPAEFDRERLKELLVALADHAGTINTYPVAERLGAFLQLSFQRVEDQRGRYGSNFPFTIQYARHKDFSGTDRKLYLSVPLRGTDPSALSQLYKMLAATDGGKVLPILLYPGIADHTRALSQQIGVSQPELLFLDCIDLLRIAEVPIAQRVLALQQVLLPRMPSLGRRTYQTAGPVAAELFRGRRSVIDELTSPRGKTVLFSGRMMGKSSVLSRIRDQIETAPGGGHHCVFLSVSTDILLEPLLDKLTAFLPLDQRKGAQRERERLAPSAQDISKRQQEKERDKLQLLRRVIEGICAESRLTILIDEADRFARNDATKDRDFSLAWLLRDLENHAPDKLRIVFAGFQTLHHEVIAANGAFANWFGQCQLGPLEREEAVSLIKEPLADFGVQFVSDAGVERILEFSGGYPLLIQEVCARLMERSMARRPIPIKPGDEVLLLSAGEVETVCREESLRTRLHQVLSLNLDEYPRLKLVTYLILQAGMYRPVTTDGSQADQFKVEDVQSMLVDWYGDKLSDYFSDTSLPGLVEELVSLGLIARYGDGYRFLNRTFAAMLRGNPSFEGELLSLIEQVANPRDSEARRYWSLPMEHLDGLLRSRTPTLLVGLPSTLKSQIVQTLFDRSEIVGGTDQGSSILIANQTIDNAAAVESEVHKRLRETRTTLSLGDLCVKAKIETLVLDCPRLPFAEIVSIASDLSARASIRLLATGDAAVARLFVKNPPVNFDVVALRRLRPRDIQAWGEQPYKRDGGWEFSLVIDQQTAHSLMSATCGYFPLLQQFREHCEMTMQRASEYYPSEDTVEAFRKRLTAARLQSLLLAPLDTVEKDTLKRLFELAITLEPSSPNVDKELAQDEILDLVQDENELIARLDAIELLLLLDLMTDVQGRYIFENHNLLKLAFGL